MTYLNLWALLLQYLGVVIISSPLITNTLSFSISMLLNLMYEYNTPLSVLDWISEIYMFTVLGVLIVTLWSATCCNCSTTLTYIDKSQHFSLFILQKEIALYTASRVNSEFCFFDIDDDLDPLFKVNWLTYISFSWWFSTVPLNNVFIACLNFIAFHAFDCKYFQCFWSCFLMHM